MLVSAALRVYDSPVLIGSLKKRPYRTENRSRSRVHVSRGRSNPYQQRENASTLTSGPGGNEEELCHFDRYLSIRLKRS